MKRLIACLVFGLALVQAGRGSTAPVYSTPVTAPPAPVPVVDATNFFMNGVFDVTVSSASLYYDFSNVQNFTNRNTVAGDPGLRFDTAPTSSGSRHPAKNFINANNVNTNFNNTLVSGATYLSIEATNIVNRGMLGSANAGLIRVKGETVDVSRGTMALGTFGVGGGILDLYWGYSTNLFDPGTNSLNLITNAPFVPPHTATYPNGFTNNFYTFPSFSSPAGTNGPLSGPGLRAYLRTNVAGTNLSVTIVYVRTHDTNLTVNVAGTSAAGQLGIVSVEWSQVSTNIFGQVVTNYLTLIDTYGAVTTNIFFTNFATTPPTLQPENFIIFQSTAPFVIGTPMSSYARRVPDTFFGTNTPATLTSNQVASYGVQILTTGTDPSRGSPQLSFADNVRSLSGRVEISGSKTLNLNLARVQGMSYTLLSATNHFVGSTNAVINTAYADIRLGSTNGALIATSVIQPSIRRISGPIDMYSGVWEGTPDFGGGTNPGSGHYQVVYIDALLTGETPSVILDLDLRSKLGTNKGAVTIGDTFNIYGRLTVDAGTLTVATNGALNLATVANPDDGDWAGGVPYLHSFTNFGAIFGPNSLYFFGRGLASGGSDLPYTNFFNQGFIQSDAVIIKANNVENRGLIEAFTGGIQIEAGTVTIGNAPVFGGQLIADQSDINLTCLNLNMDGELLLTTLAAGHALQLSISNSINVGSNFWSVGDGFNLYVKPTTGDFNLVTISSFATEFEDSISIWAGEDRGLSGTGFTDNAALGRLVLDGAANSAFTFADLNEGDSVINALYVDVLVLRNNATNLNGSVLANIYVRPEMRLYYSRLFFDTTEVTGSISGASGDGSFQQLTHAGPINTASGSGSGGSGGTTIANVNLKVSMDSPETVHLSWNTVAGAVNYVYYRSPMAGDEWHLLTQFNSTITGTVGLDDNPGVEARLYKVRVDLPETQ